MFVRHICFPITTLGPGKRLGIWVSGCSKACVGCMSEELKNREESDRISLESLQRMITGYAGRIEGVTISGGEPFRPGRRARNARGVPVEKRQRGHSPVHGVHL